MNPGRIPKADTPFSAWMVKHGYTTAYLAKKVGCGAMTIYRLRHGKVSVHPFILAAIKRKFPTAPI